MLRDPRMKQLMFVAPIVQLIVFGYAVNTDVRYAPLLFIDHDLTAQSRGLADALEASTDFRITRSDGATGAAARALDHGDALVVVEMPPEFSRDMGSGQPVEVQVLADGTHSMSANVARGAAALIIENYVQHGSTRSRAGAESHGGLDLRPQAWYNPDLKSRVYNVPAVAGMLLMLMALLLTSMAVVRERELGTLEQLMVSPLTPGELILGKTMPVALVAVLQLALVITVARLWFAVPVPGQSTCPALRRGAVHPVGPGHRPADLDRLPDPAGGVHGHVPLLPARDDAVGVHVPGGEHAGGLPVPDPAQPDPSFPGHRARRLPQGGGARDAVAPVPGAWADCGGAVDGGQPAVPKAPELSCK